MTAWLFASRLTKDVGRGNVPVPVTMVGATYEGAQLPFDMKSEDEGTVDFVGAGVGVGAVADVEFEAVEDATTDASPEEEDVGPKSAESSRCAADAMGNSAGRLRPTDGRAR